MNGQVSVNSAAAGDVFFSYLHHVNIIMPFLTFVDEMMLTAYEAGKRRTTLTWTHTVLREEKKRLVAR